MDNLTYISIIKLIERNERAIRDINKNVVRIDSELLDIIKSKTLGKPSPPRPSISKAIKQNIATFTTVTVAVLGALGTILFEIGKHLKNMPVN